MNDRQTDGVHGTLRDQEQGAVGFSEGNVVVSSARGGEGVVERPDLGAGTGGWVDLEEHPDARPVPLRDPVERAVRMEVDPADVLEADRPDGGGNTVVYSTFIRNL